MENRCSMGGRLQENCQRTPETPRWLQSYTGFMVPWFQNGRQTSIFLCFCLILASLSNALQPFFFKDSRNPGGWWRGGLGLTNQQSYSLSH